MGEESSGTGNIHTHTKKIKISHFIEIPKEVMASESSDYQWTAFSWLTWNDVGRTYPGLTSAELTGWFVQDPSLSRLRRVSWRLGEHLCAL